MDMPKVESILASFLVRDATSSDYTHGADRFAFEPDGFYRVLQRRALALLRQRAGPGTRTMAATSATLSMKLACAIAVLQFLAAHFYAAVTGSVPVAALAGLCLVGCWGVGHNFMHQSDGKAGPWRYAMDLCPGVSSAEFRITHSLSHHLVPNLSSDYEALWFVSDGPWVYTNPKFIGAIPGHMWFIVGIISPFTGVLEVLARALATRDVRRITASLLPVCALLSHRALRQSWASAALLFAAELVAFSLAMYPIGLMVHHSAGATTQGRDTFAWHQGQPNVHTRSHVLVATLLLPVSASPLLALPLALGPPRLR